MSTKDPVLLTVLIDTARMRWLAGGIAFDNQIHPLLASADNDLTPYTKMEFDEQASFLRHRCCGVLQRGCDRLWGIKKKASHFVFVIDGPFPRAPELLTERVAEHLAQWMTNPPVVFFSANSKGFQEKAIQLTKIAGDIPETSLEPLTCCIAELIDAASKPEVWEQLPAAKR